jgi:transaldolase
MSRIFLYADSADRNEVGALLGDRLVHGVTTNPTILRRDGVGPDEMRELYREWTGHGAAEVFFQATGEDRAAMEASGLRIAELGTGAVVKVPATTLGFPVAARLAASGVPVLVTAVYSSAQAVTASAIGARYIAPYLGRLDDTGVDGLALVREMVALLAGTETSALVASVRSPERIVELVASGVRHVTASPAVLRAALHHDASEAAAVVFERDATQF